MTANSKKNLIITLTCLALIFGCEECFRRKLGGFAGSYPFVEYWDINATEKEIIKAIEEIKIENPDLQPPNQKELTSIRSVDYDYGSDEMIQYMEKYLKDSLTPKPPMTKNNTKSAYWLYIDFYYKSTNQVVHTWTRPDSEGKNPVTTFALVSFSKYDNPYDYKLINRDFWYVANKIEISKFQKTIVDKIQERIDKNRQNSIK
jgi:hypothetical protein